MTVSSSRAESNPILPSQAQAVNSQPNAINAERLVLVPHQIEAAPQLAAELARPPESEGVVDPMARSNELLLSQGGFQLSFLNSQLEFLSEIAKAIHDTVKNITSNNK